MQLPFSLKAGPQAPWRLEHPTPILAMQYAAFLVAYVALDWVSFVYPFGRFGITPWNPQIGFAIALVVLAGPRLVPAFILGPILADGFMRPHVVPLLVSVTISVISGGMYSLAALSLRQVLGNAGLPPQKVRDLALIFAAAVVVTIIVATAVVGLYVVFGFVVSEDALAATVRLWIGDLIGIILVLPLGLLLADRHWRPFPRVEILINVALLAVTVAVVAIISRRHQLVMFYLLFLPIVFIAVRLGYEAVVASLATVQIAIIVIGQFSAMSADEVTTLQGLLLVLAVTGMTAGMLVTEQRRSERALRQQQDVQARLQQLGSLGELTSLIAHEVNQPLMAAGTYTRLILEATASAIPSDRIGELAQKAAQQVTRAGDVVRKLRELVRLGRSLQEPVSVAQIFEETKSLIEQDLASRRGVRFEILLPEDLPPVRADRIQIEQVLLNLIRNAMEALDSARTLQGLVLVSARRIGDQVEVMVEDNGPGFSPSLKDGVQPLQSTKPGGLGIGLALSRTIVELHKGTFAIESDSQGARVRFTLPRAFPDA